MDRRFEYRSLFWPILLIGVGVIWLLGNLGVIRAVNLLLLLRLWPLILIVIGLDLLIGRKSSLASALIGLGALAVVIVVLAVGPGLGMTQGVPTKTERFTEPIGAAISAQVTLNLHSPGATVEALRDSPNLIDAEITHVGEIDFKARGDQEKTISLDYRGGITWGWSLPFENLKWEIGLTPDIPLSLVVDGGSGAVRLDLAGLKLSKLTVDRGSGSFTILLPESSAPYEAEIEGGSGHLDLSLPGSTTLTVCLSGGSGSQDVRLPVGAAVRLDVRDNGSGDVSLPSGWVQLEDGEGEDQGLWETPGYEQAAHKILIIVEALGSGSIHIR